MGRPSAKAVAMVEALQLDVLIYPELGMDALMVLSQSFDFCFGLCS